jgi:glycosyltransferase involved in cell wall biosynthesis
MIDFGPQAIHIATEGPLGQMAKFLCHKWAVPFTTSYHTKFPEYIKARLPIIPLSWSYRFVRGFHNAGGRTMVTTPSMVQFLSAKGFTKLAPWARGVDTVLFNPDKKNTPENVYKNLERPIWVNVGRVAVEKNLEAFLDINLPGTKVIVGDGPQRQALERKYPNVVFTGAKFETELARHFADADVFVFPSKTDTFGLVIIEAMASGLPVAAYPVSGPIDIIPGSKAGVVNDNLEQACLQALELNPADSISHAKIYSWEAVTDVFLELLTPQYEPRKRWRRVRRMRRLATNPYHSMRKFIRRVTQFARGPR